MAKLYLQLAGGTFVLSAALALAALHAPWRVPVEAARPAPPPIARQSASKPVASPSPKPASPGEVRLRAARNGNYYAEATYNGARAKVMIDTGATLVALTYEDAERAGLILRDADFRHRSSTANGIVTTAHVTLSEIRLGQIVLHDVPAAVLRRGALSTSLLGMSFLTRLSSFRIEAGWMYLRR